MSLYLLQDADPELLFLIPMGGNEDLEQGGEVLAHHEFLIPMGGNETFGKVAPDELRPMFLIPMGG